MLIVGNPTIILLFWCECLQKQTRAPLILIKTRKYIEAETNNASGANNNNNMHKHKCRRYMRVIYMVKLSYSLSTLYLCVQMFCFLFRRDWISNGKNDTHFVASKNFSLFHCKIKSQNNYLVEHVYCIKPLEVNLNCNTLYSRLANESENTESIFAAHKHFGTPTLLMLYGIFTAMNVSVTAKRIAIHTVNGRARCRFRLCFCCAQ